MVKLRDAIEDCGLADMGFKGARFTWSRGNSISSLVNLE